MTEEQSGQQELTEGALNHLANLLELLHLEPETIEIVVAEMGKYLEEGDA
ncbi:MAG: hypothetical protein M1358_03640 [Chloroflexi bacterium]|nr:hypothetical protein [Chloroflexota bacterium]